MKTCENCKNWIQMKELEGKCVLYGLKHCAWTPAEATCDEWVSDESEGDDDDCPIRTETETCQRCQELTDTILNRQCEEIERLKSIINVLNRPPAEAVMRDATAEERASVQRYIDSISVEAVQRWIPCSERLPETHTEYVIENPWMQVSITKDTYQLSNPVLGYGKRKYHSDGDPMMAVVRYEDDGYDRTGWITAPDCEDIDVIAWMPLPPPYRERKEE